ncbi:MAG TPA: HEAT repeat domain-containing protein [Terriglobia bacterium]|nr:HEAT repeat domain-containing protein [Terriglobia bacterium]
MENLSHTGMKRPGGKQWRLALLALAALAFWPISQMTAASLPAQIEQERSELLNHQWDPAKLYAMLTAQDPAASENLYRAAFAAGPAIIPKLESALKDDRTAEFAAQMLAYFANERSLAILEKLLKDPRDLDLRRFYYGALGGSGNPHRTEILLNKVLASDHEPDRDVTQNAILALSISSDAALVPRLRQAQMQVTDPVIQDDIETAAMVVELRAKFMATAAGKSAGGSVEQTIRSYFMPALEAPPAAKDEGQQNAGVEINVKDLTYSPDKTRVLAGVDFENPEAVASYHMVLQKNEAGWKVASVWLGEEREKPQPPANPAPHK